MDNFKHIVIELQEALQVVELCWTSHWLEAGKRNSHFEKEKKARPRELQASQSHLCTQHGHGADPPVNSAKAHGK